MEKQFIDSIMPIVSRYLITKSNDNFDLLHTDLNRSNSNKDFENFKCELDFELNLLFGHDEEKKLAYIRCLFGRVFSFIKNQMTLGIEDAANLNNNK